MQDPDESPVLMGVKFAALLVLFAAGAAATETKPLRVLCWNIHHGVGGDGRLDLERIAKVIRNANPDLVALQEVDNQCARSGRIDQTAALARLTGMNGVFGKAMDFGGGSYGQAILSRHPVRSSKVHALPSGNEPRIAFEATVTIDGRETRIISTHFDLDEAKRLDQAEVLANLPITRAPAVLCGDFNTTPQSPPWVVLAKSWSPVLKKEPAFTHPAHKPDTEIDHVFTRGPTTTAPVIILPESIASDHRPMLVELRIVPM